MKSLIGCLIGIIISLSSFAQEKVLVPRVILDKVVLDLVDLDFYKAVNIKKDSIITTHEHTDSLNNVVILSLNKKVKSYQADSVTHIKEIDIKEGEIKEERKKTFKEHLKGLGEGFGAGFIVFGTMWLIEKARND